MQEADGLLLLTNQQEEISSGCISCVTLLPSKVTTAIYLHCPLPVPHPHLRKVQRKCVGGHCPQRYREERYLQILFGWCKLTYSVEVPGQLVLDPIQFSS